MNSNLSIINLLGRLWRHISPRRRWQFKLLLILMLLASFAEILSIGAVLPFLGVLTAPDRIFEMPVIQPLIQALGLTEPKQLLLPLTIAFGFGAVIAGAMRLLLVWASTRLSFATGADLSISIYRRTLYQSYTVHCARNSSEVIAGISIKSNGVIYDAIVPTLMLISSSVILFFIMIALLTVEPLVALVAFGGLSVIYLCIIRLTRKQLIVDSKCVASESSQVIKSLQEGLGGIRDVLIDGTQEVYCQIYRKADLQLRRAQGNSLFISASPRYGMEALGMLLIASLAYSMAQQVDGITKAIPILGALALGAQRLLPLLQQAYASWTQINSGQSSLKDALDLLDQPLPKLAINPVERLPFNQNIVLKDLGFRYDDQAPQVLKQLNLTINKGSRIGFIGTTGSGKSTLLDIVMALLQPTEGTMEIDGQIVTLANYRAWQDHIAHVPQTIFLADSTVEENIAFGVPRDEIDQSRVKWAAQQAQIAETIESWSKQYQAFVGERGVRLSGGQRQRIGIARALYKRADVIIFDEATSALDSITEQAVMQSIEGLTKDLTVLMIAHRITTLKNCTMLVELAGGKILRQGSYEQLTS
jgi:ABC-type multidrug transport system fused ATPase/permease subunit